MYDNMRGLVMKAVPKLDESESGQMVLKQDHQRWGYSTVERLKRFEQR